MRLFLVTVEKFVLDACFIVHIPGIKKATSKNYTLMQCLLLATNGSNIDHCTCDDTQKCNSELKLTPSGLDFMNWKKVFESSNPIL